MKKNLTTRRKSYDWNVQNQNLGTVWFKYITSEPKIIWAHKLSFNSSKYHLYYILIYTYISF